MIDERNLLVAMDLGLGKTVLVIAAVERLIDSGDIGGGLVIVPSSLKYQWARQIDKFTGGKANVLVVDGDPKRRYRQYSTIRAGKVEYAIMNYEQVVNDWRLVQHLPRDFICCDEIQALRNPGTKRSKRIKMLDAHYRWGLTGQPVENRAEELFSLMQWVDPTVLGPSEVFESTFIVRDGWGSVRRYRNLPVLHKALSRAMVRRTWDDPEIRDQMPAVSEESILVDLAPAARRLYRLISTELLAVLENTQFSGGFNIVDHYEGGGSGMEGAGDVMSRLICLRMLCDHPALLRRSADIYAGEAVPLGGGSQTGSVYAHELRTRGLLNLPPQSPKFDATIELIQEILEADPKNKVVLFSFFKGALALLAERTSKFVDHALFTGNLTALERDINKQRFLTDPKCRLFLSSDAGGTGLDLPVANFLISLDLPWSAGAWNQRNGRIIRLSSEFRHITLISMLVADSIEERQYDMLTQKQAIATAITDGRGADAKGNLSLDLGTLTEFLRSSLSQTH